MRRHIVPALQPLFLISSKRMTIFRKIYYIKIGINHPMGKHVFHVPANRTDYRKFLGGKQCLEFGQCQKFLLRNSNRSFNQRKLEQISPNIISRPFIYESMHAHTYIYIIEITIGRFYFVLLDRKLRHCPLCQRRTTVSQRTKHAVGSLRRTLDRSEVHNSLIV